MKTSVALAVFLLIGLWPPTAFDVPAEPVTIVDRLNPGAYARVDHTGALVTSGGGSGGDAVNVFHQSTIAHVSSVTHVSGGVFIRDPSIGTNARITHVGELVVNCTTGCSASTSDTVNVFHQSTVRHVSSVLHVAVIDLPRWTHIAVAQSGAWDIRAAHIVGSPNVGLGVLVSHTGEMFVNCTTGCSASTSDTVNVFHQSTVRHISSVTHVAAAGGALQVQANTGTGFLTCHMAVAVHQTASATVIHSNGGMRVFICGIVLVSAHAQGISLIEGVGTTCQTGSRPILGSITTGSLRPENSMVMAASGGFSAIAPFPWAFSEIASNAVCLMQTGAGTVSGGITYRYAP